MTGSDSPESTGRDQAGRWTRGNAGNPAGRPPGSRHAAYRALDQIGQDGAEAALRAVVKAAGAGDLRAAEILLSRCWPAGKGRPVPLPLPPLRTPADILAAHAALIAALAEGAISAEEAQAVGTVIESTRKAIETGDLAARIAALEAARIPTTTAEEPHP